MKPGPFFYSAGVMHSCPEPVKDLSSLPLFFDDLNAARLSEASYFNHEIGEQFTQPGKIHSKPYVNNSQFEYILIRWSFVPLWVVR